VFCFFFNYIHFFQNSQEVTLADEYDLIEQTAFIQNAINILHRLCPTNHGGVSGSKKTPLLFLSIVTLSMLCINCLGQSFVGVNTFDQYIDYFSRMGQNCFVTV
jgi:hypothetical protein